MTDATTMVFIEGYLLFVVVISTVFDDVEVITKEVDAYVACMHAYMMMS